MLRSIFLLLTTFLVIQAAEFSTESLLGEVATMRAMLTDDARAADFVRTYADPKHIATIAASEGGFEQAAKLFVANGKAKVLADTLAQIDPATAVTDAEKMTISFPPSIEGKRRISFLFADGKWYIKD